MALSILNNIPSLAAQNQLAITGSNLQRTLFRMSSGSRINSGADDAAGLAIADGLRANITALTQSARNANDGVGSLQVADGSLAQVTTLLNRAITLATESATGTVSNTQRTALDAEFSAIKAEIDRIGTNTTFNGTGVFTNTATSIFLSDSTSGGAGTISTTTGLLSAAALGLVAGTITTNVPAVASTATVSATGLPSAGETINVAGQTYTFRATLTGANDVLIGGTMAATMANLAAAVNGTAGAGTTYGTGTTANANASAVVNGSVLNLTAKTAGTAGNSLALSSTSSVLSLVSWAGGAAASTTTTTMPNDLLTAADAQITLTAINQAIQNVAGTRGALGAAINRLQSAVNVIQNQSQNLSAAEDGIRAADIAQEVANMTKFSILNQTGISSLAQANQMQQQVLALLR
ncbi:MAG: flagellin [Acidobacteria bacterium]|nr:MAG: flagellin [Acidobacteriota bacterium]